MDWDKLISLLAEQDLIKDLSDKRPGVSKLPAQLYVRLIMAAIATEKDIASCISTALETYAMRSEEKHLTEIKFKAAERGISLEEYMCEAIKERFNK